MMMIALAVVIDTVQFFLVLIPFVGWLLNMIIGFVANVIFAMWFSHVGVSLWNPKRVLAFLGESVAEFLPIIDGFCWLTVLVAYTVISEWRSSPEI